MQHAAVGVRDGSAAAPGGVRDWVTERLDETSCLKPACLHVLLHFLRCGGGRRRRRRCVTKVG